MKTILINDDNLTKEDIEEKVIRCKGIIINKHKDVTLVYAHKTYQFPGGHLIEGENLEECLVREIEEETGIILKEFKLTPFMEIIYYSHNYRNEGHNRENDLYYYLIETESVSDETLAHPDNWERKGNIKVCQIPLAEIENVLNKSILDNSINEIIVKEMKTVLKEVKKIVNEK